MKKYACILAFVVFFLNGLPAYPQSQPEMTAQSQADFDKADARLNKLYKETLAGLDAEGKMKLIASERAWLTYRDAEATFEADSERGGSMAPMIYNQACLELTEARIKQLGKASE